MGLNKRNIVIFLALAFGIAIGFYGINILGYLKNLSSKEAVVQNETPTPVSQGRTYPASFPTNNMIEKRLDLNDDGEAELLLTSSDSSGGYAVMVDPDNTSKAISNIFKFPTSSFAEEYKFKSTEPPEVLEIIDLNANGRQEMIFDLKDGGAYTTTEGIVIFTGTQLQWLELEEEGGKMRPAIFRNGSSVRNANVFRILPSDKAIVELAGVGDVEGNWTWEVKAYKWNGAKYKSNITLATQILAQQPKRMQP